MNRKRRYPPLTSLPTSVLSSPTCPPANDPIYDILHAREPSARDAAESLNIYVDEFNYIIGDNGQKMLIAGMTALKHSPDDIAVAFQTYWFSDVGEAGKPLRCDGVVISKAFKSIQDGSKNTWFFQKFAKGGEGYEESLTLLEIGICCAYGESDAVKADAVSGWEDSTDEEDGVEEDDDDDVEEEDDDDDDEEEEDEDDVEGDDTVKEEDVVVGEDAVKEEGAVECEDTAEAEGEDALEGKLLWRMSNNREKVLVCYDWDLRTDIWTSDSLIYDRLRSFLISYRLYV